MNTLAKRVYNIAPDPVRLTFDDDDAVTLDVRSAEFFQEEFQGEGVDRTDGTVYRLVSDGEDDPLLAASEGPDGWQVVGEVVGVEAAAEE